MRVSIGGEVSSDFDSLEPRVGGDQVEVFDRGFENHLFNEFFPLQDGGKAVELVWVVAKTGSEVCLRIEIDEEDFFLVVFGKGRSNIEGDGCFCCSTFETADGNDFHVLLLRCKRRYE